jgi:cytochrome c-type biogenesis protein CcmE
LKRAKFIIPATVLLVAVAFLGYRGFAESAVYDYQVSEFLGQQSDYTARNVRVSGTVADGTVQKEGSTLRFVMTDGQQDLPVSYVGVVPDSFKAGGQAVVEGTLDPEGTFQATTLLAKCPSKYEPDTAPAG